MLELPEIHASVGIGGPDALGFDRSADHPLAARLLAERRRGAHPPVARGRPDRPALPAAVGSQSRIAPIQRARPATSNARSSAGSVSPRKASTADVIAATSSSALAPRQLRTASTSRASPNRSPAAVTVSVMPSV